MCLDIRDVIADIQFEIYSDEEIISENGNPLILYNEKLEGNLLDIGCGQSGYILSMLNTKLNFYALDPDPKQINYLLLRINRISPGREITTINNPFNSELFPELRFEYIIMSNLLHLKEAIPDLENFLQDVRKVMAKNCMILICVHAGSILDILH